ncbi:pre-mRNA-splicing factor CWC26, putative [Plasmodium berghei]|uniref:Pre-mRNA-splicing factor CWC26, putative n=2 Tax=Plasmodium berghei TaxID=5821 RepID=A0A509AWE0_PLABA|nr:pre-mRNA-splicing factor CWC26, putative [Plasmodium berghei ANKA]CXJ28598.1 pre-mRNA-splicing factor CWC26, putative [Plasmodium berghei]SCM27052.1 pre-mRNA-splicing factor CWC26, putative [Plasmodium berghei]SCN28778.1 pre-mRNA-splicing factor CWC26, putative [Plasmodium berghei]SCO64525.1 pre-mRNA-splicing factor CWC26, putative [Plasmodium berghei]VUC58661.1 pre-mRNA-splicing factor CWC26, putative [Plasmodium berghei ANKA]|eukprot:XP_034424424.1 pre-mRNA-splicing factor CWC26, putative [Plasmodium berghei ANKA]
MEEYLRNKYLKNDVEKKKKKNKKGKIKIHDSDDENERFNKNNIKNNNSEEYNLIESDSSSDIPITIMQNDGMDILDLSREKKKKILQVLNNDILVDSSFNDVDKNPEKKKKKKKEKGLKNLIKKAHITKQVKQSQHNDIDEQNYNHKFNNTEVKHISKPSLNSNKNSKQINRTSSEETYRRQKCNNHRGSSSDISLPRRKGKEQDSSSDISLPRRKGKEQDSSSDISLPRKEASRSTSMDSQPGGKGSNIIEYSSGLSNKKNNEEENEVVKNFDKNTNTIYRDKAGKIISREEWIKNIKNEKSRYRHGIDEIKENNKNERNKRNRKSKKYNNDQNIKLEWGTGLVQKEMREKIIKENKKLVNKKNIINYDYDSDYDQKLKQDIRKEDPMNKYLVQSNQENQKAKCRYQSPYNRFNILAGYRWDGVIRGNGFEQKRYEILKEKELKDRLAYI